MNEETRIDDGSRRRSRTSLLLIAGIAFVPMFIAYMLFFYFPQFIPTSTTNKGTLIEPPASVDELALDSGDWTLLVISAGACEVACRRALYLARQIDIGLGKDDGRVQRMLVLSSAPVGEMAQRLAEEYPNLDVREVTPDALSQLGSLLPPGVMTGAILLADPNGNLMMYYTSEQGGEALRSDLKHLLRLSNIG